MADGWIAQKFSKIFYNFFQKISHFSIQKRIYIQQGRNYLNNIQFVMSFCPKLQTKPKCFQPKVITHRGLCSVFVQNTIQAIVAALYSSDLVELDILLTKDDQIIVFHDRGLKRVTDVENHPEFLGLLKQANIEDDNKSSLDWWVRDFTLSELKRLNLRQDDPNRPRLSHLNYKIPTLEQVLDACIAQKSKAVSGEIITAGLLVEIKEEEHGSLFPRDIHLCNQLSKLLKKFRLDNSEMQTMTNFPIHIQSFNIPLLKFVQTDNLIYHLYDETSQITEELLRKNQHKNVVGIGITEDNFKTAEGSLRSICDIFNYELNYWTIRDDRMKKIPFQLSNYQQVYLKLKELGVNGFITEFPDKCKGYLGINPHTSFSQIPQEPLQKQNQPKLPQSPQSPTILIAKDLNSTFELEQEHYIQIQGIRC